MKTENNPAQYRAMSEPHESGEAFQAALDAFFDDVRAARLKHRIRDVVVIGCGSMKISDGPDGVDEGDGQAMANLGDSFRAQRILAQALGSQVVVDRQYMMALRARAERGSR